MVVQDEECSGRPSKGDHIQLILLKLYDHSTVIWHLQQIRKVEKLGRGYLMSWLKIKSSFWSVIFSYSTLQWAVSQLDCDLWCKVDFIQQPAMTSSMIGPRRSSRALPRAKLASEKRWGSLSGDLLPVWSTIAFWIPARPLHLRIMLS